MSSNRLTRCRFVQTAGTAIALPIFVPAAALGRQGAVAPSDRILLGMIGSGDRANQLADCLLGVADVQVVAVCDPSRPKRVALQERAERAYAARRQTARSRAATITTTSAIC